MLAAKVINHRARINRCHCDRQQNIMDDMTVCTMSFNVCWCYETIVRIGACHGHAWVDVDGETLEGRWVFGDIASLFCLILRDYVTVK